MSKLINHDSDYNNAARLLNLPDATSAQEPATLAQLQAVENGLAWKTPPADVGTTGNINLSSPGGTIDGVTMAGIGGVPRVLVFNQTLPAQNGIYSWNGPASVMTRTSDGATTAELNSAAISITQGTANGGTTWKQSTINPVVGTDPIVWGALGTTPPSATTSTPGIAALATQSEVNAGAVTNKIVTPATLAGYTGVVRKASVTFGDGSSTSYTLNHNLGTADITWRCRVVSSGNEVGVEVDTITTTQATVVTKTAVASNAYRITFEG